jgi:hypothetical protein
MANLLTGDCEAVLQVSASTLNRLLASMHQNAGGDPGVPSFPHSVGVRLGDKVKVDGVQGTAWAQVSVPRIELIDGATDRFLLDVALRIRYQPDPDSFPLPTYINGTLRAVYALEDIDPNCLGWRKLASEYLWIRVVEDTVSFTGTGTYEEGVEAPLGDDQAVSAAVTRQAVALLSSVFDPAPHQIGAFRRGTAKSINQAPATMPDQVFGEPPSQDVPVGGSAVVIPVGLTGDPPGGALNSLQNVVLAGSDMAVAVDKNVLMSQVDAGLDGIKRYDASFPVEVRVAGYAVSSTSYHIWVEATDAKWSPFGSYAEVQISLSVRAHTDAIPYPKFTFSITQPFRLEFDQAGQVLRLSAGSTNVSGEPSGVWSVLPSGWWDGVRESIRNTVYSLAVTAASNAQPSLDQIGAGRARLDAQLATMDKQSYSRFVDASFHQSGIILRGWISVAPRRRPEVSFRQIGSGAFSALDTWIPGGRVDSFHWSWRFFNNASLPPGETDFGDRYVLSRPHLEFSKFGKAIGVDLPLPGLDGQGVLCLSVTGHVVDTVTGNLVPIEAAAHCTRFGLEFAWPYAPRLFVGQLVDQRPVGPPPHPSDAGVLEVTTRGRPAADAANTLMVYVDEAWTDDDARALSDGLDECERHDAGLLVLLLFREGLLGGVDNGPLRNVQALASRLQAPLMVSEDLQGGWSTAFSLHNGSGQPAWRLLDPHGGVVWKRDGRVAPEELAHALDHCLYPSPMPRPAALRSDLPSVLLSPAAMGSMLEHSHPERRHCPPWSGLDVDVRTVFSDAAFVQAGSASSTADSLLATFGAGTEDGPDVMVVVDGANDEEVGALRAELGPAFTVVADPDGTLAGGVGVRYWPTTVPIGERSPDREPAKKELT